MIRVGELEKIDRETLLSVPVRGRGEKIEDAFGVYIIPNGEQHDSGWGCMRFVAETGNGYVGFGGICDSATLIGHGFKVDCVHPSGIVHIWNRYGFVISNDGSDMDFVSRYANRQRKSGAR